MITNRRERSVEGDDISSSSSSSCSSCSGLSVRSVATLFGLSLVKTGFSSSKSRGIVGLTSSVLRGIFWDLEDEDEDEVIARDLGMGWDRIEWDKMG
jgi:hypothetical protein